MNRFFYAIVFLFFATYCQAQDKETQSKIKYYSEKATRYLDKQKALSAFYSIDKEGIKMYASAKDKQNKLIEFSIGWDKLNEYKKELNTCNQDEVFKTYTQGKYQHNPISENTPAPTVILSNTYSFKKLQGLKIAIDAGHTAGNIEMGQVESKCLKFNCIDANGLKDSIEIVEGMLTFATAKLLKEKLEAEGATVFLTRPFNGSTAFGITFDDWLKKNYTATVDKLYQRKKINLEKKNWLLSSKATKRDKFRLVFKDLELQKRAEIINNYHPDFTIIIHYNVDETNTGWTKPGIKNYSMAFVGGAFMKSDLSSAEKRFEFLRLLVSDDLEKSILLSSSVLTCFQKQLNVPAAKINDANYLYEGCISATSDGVYCRNLQLTRYIHSPLIYGETLYQDNITECKWLTQEFDKTKNVRLQQIAKAYYDGILNYCLTNTAVK